MSDDVRNEVSRLREEREQLRSQAPELFNRVLKILQRHDPMGIYEEDMPHRDAYDPEVGTIVPRLPAASSAEDVQTIVYEEFVRWFYTPFGGSIAKSRAAYEKIAHEIWAVWKSHSTLGE